MSARSFRAEIQKRFGNAVGIALILLATFVVVNAAIPRGFPFFAQAFIDGLTNGGIYALIALGYTMVYGIIELINFAHGDVFTLGAFISFALLPMFGISQRSPSSLGLVVTLIGIALITMAICAAVNVAIERVAYRPLRNAPRLAPLITAIGMSSILEGLMYLWRGPFTVNYPDLLPSQQLSLGGTVTIGVRDLMVIATAVVTLLRIMPSWLSQPVLRGRRYSPLKANKPRVIGTSSVMVGIKLSSGWSCLTSRQNWY